MKQVIVYDGLEEFAVRPRETFNAYIALLEQDVARQFADRGDFVRLPCPGCGSAEVETAFTKLTFTYVRCRRCRSVFASPRPTPHGLAGFAAASEAARFWRSTVEAQTARSRVHSIVRPRAAWIRAAAADMAAPALADLHTKYPSFLDEVCRSGAFAEVISVEPAVDLGDGERPLRIEPTLDGAVARGLRVSVLSAQECLERAASPDHLLACASRLVHPGGLFFATTVTSSGFDLQILGGRAKNILPPTHLNLLSLAGIRSLWSRHGFEIVELSTPGQLDVEIVAHAAAEDPGLDLPPFVDELIRRRDQDAHQAFQRFLQEERLSSHVRLVARKADDAGP